jgi:hypothetical protein
MSEILKAIRKAAEVKEGLYSVVGVVKEVQKGERTCTIEPTNGDATLYGVRLQANIENTEGVVVFPKVESNVVVTFLNEHTGYVALMSEVETVKISRDGFDLKEQIEDLLKLQNAILDTLINFKMLTNMGATVGVFPSIILDVKKLKQDNENLKQKFNKILG